MGTVDSLNLLALALLAVALYGIKEHRDARRDAECDEEAMDIIGHQEEIDRISVRADIEDENLRMMAKVGLVIVLAGSSFSPRTSLAELDVWGAISTVGFVVMMTYLTIATNKRKRFRRKMLTMALANKGRDGGVG